MRASEFILEGKKSESPDEHLRPMSTSMQFPKMNGFYEFYRFGNIVAGSPGKDVSKEHEHFLDHPTAFAYTDAEHEMLKHSAKKMGKRPKYITKEKSREPLSTNSASPVPHNSGRKK